MATRKLIIAALCCGLAILLAGGLWLVATGRDDSGDAVPLLDPGQSATVAGLEVMVLGGALDQQDVVLTLEVAVPADAAEVDDLAAGWTVISPTGTSLSRTEADRPIDVGAPPCAAVSAAPGSTERCFLLFALAGGEPSAVGFTAVYERDGESAAWLIQ